MIGPNGAGKTTLFHCVTGTLQPSSGSVKLFGQEVTYLPEYQRTKLGMGRTFQITNVFTDLSLAENLALADRRAPTGASGSGTGRSTPSLPFASRRSRDWRRLA